MSGIIQALERIINWLQKYDPEPETIPPGFSLLQIQELTKKLPFKLPLEVCKLYQYCNGKVGITPYSRLFSLEEALKICLSYIYTEVFLIHYSSEELSKNFCNFMSHPDAQQFLFAYYPLTTYRFPLFVENDGLCYVICDENEKKVSPIWYEFIGREPVIYSASLTSLMLTFAECYETGGYYVTSEYKAGVTYSYTEIDVEKAEKIFQKYNPAQIDVWREIWID
ncbi:SMI1/KNR4 family protein [Oscillatoria salina]|uniref:SMI1/KNR4 family protein n=1 Tax=Oscillatoria salina TaxID=331517 RepID=UPI001CCD15C3|nr:SMI1/KNR4 family protein [Oscillatoria salina]MBZ8178554.1 hypothetical protein [Oscillatoria salina IIICB1]